MVLAPVLIALAAKTSTVATPLTIPYERTSEGTVLSMDYYVPAGKGPFPFVLAIHGGAWTTGTKEDMAQLCEDLREHGVACASIEYRLGPQSRWPAMMDDSITALKFAMDRAGEMQIDKDKVGLAGFSCGGQMALLMSQMPSMKLGARIRAVLDLSGVADASCGLCPKLDKVIREQVLPTSGDSDFYLAQMSPINTVSASMPPVVIVHATGDPVVPILQSERLNKAIGQAGGTSLLYEVASSGHYSDLDRKAYRDQYHQGTGAFLYWLTDQRAKATRGRRSTGGRTSASRELSPRDSLIAK